MHNKRTRYLHQRIEKKRATHDVSNILSTNQLLFDPQLIIHPQPNCWSSTAPFTHITLLFIPKLNWCCISVWYRNVIKQFSAIKQALTFLRLIDISVETATAHTRKVSAIEKRIYRNWINRKWQSENLMEFIKIGGFFLF